MSFLVNYVPKEDRMLLTLKTPSEESSIYWVTRRQWIHLLYQLISIEQLPVVDLKALQADKVEDEGNGPDANISNVSAPTKSASQDKEEPEKSKKPEQPEIEQPVNYKTLQQIRLRRLKNAVRIVFVADDPRTDESRDNAPSHNFVLTMPNENRLALQKLIRTNAQQAGWDIGPAIQRLKKQQSQQKEQKTAPRRLH